MNPYGNSSYYSSGQPFVACPYMGIMQQAFYSRPACITQSAAGLNSHLRMLWEQHIAWTRFVIMSIVYGLPDAEAATARLLKNPGDFAAVLAPLYGDASAARFKALFTDHLVIAAQLVKAAKAGNSAAAADADKRWHANAEEIATFLAGINPYWSRSDWSEMLNDHLNRTKSEAVNMLTGKYRQSVEDYDEIENMALRMSDTMSEGILRQFPGSFS